ncbi:MAG: efflux RND transporter permease subunit [Pseudomonadota bacterium]
MSIASLSIKRPVFLTCIVLLSVVIGVLSFFKLPVDIFPDVNFPVVSVITTYPGAGPSEIETQISKVLEEEFNSISGVKSVRSASSEGLSRVIIDFTLETDVKYAEQQVRDRLGAAKRKLPEGVNEPIVRRFSPADQPIMQLTLSADLPAGELFDVANEEIRPSLEQTPQVGLVEIVGGQKREIKVELDRAKMREFEVSASQISQKLGASGANVPIGKVTKPDSEVSLRAIGEFKSLEEIKNTVVNFIGNERPVAIRDVAKVVDTLQDETAKTYHNGKKTLILYIFRQSGSNTIQVAKAITAKITALNDRLSKQPGAPQITLVRDASQQIRLNVVDVQESILIGIVLTIVVVFLFLGSGRSTLITGLALPNSLIGAFILMSVAGFSINVMSLLALSLAVGLLVDDAIVVRENIFRHRAMGKTAVQAAIDGTKEVTLAVVATTLTVIAVFGPVGFLGGVVGQFFKQFGLTICFAMLISLFDALTMAPMMSAYFGGSHQTYTKGIMGATVGRLLRAFDAFQSHLENVYERILRFSMRAPIVILIGALVIFFASFVALKHVPKTFLPPQDIGEFQVTLELPAGVSLEKMNSVATEVDQLIRSNKEVLNTLLTVGSREGASNSATFYINLVPRKQRTFNTSQFKDHIREQLKPYAYASPTVGDFDALGGGQRPFAVYIIGPDLKRLDELSSKVFQALKTHPALTDPTYGNKPGKPEVQIQLDKAKAEKYGVSTTIAGAELRTQVDGATPVVFRENGREYDIRVRMQEDQRDLKKSFNDILIPNINGRLVQLRDVAVAKEDTAPLSINRSDRARYISITSDIAAGGPGMGAAVTDVKRMLSEGETQLPPGYRYQFVGQAESFQELIVNMVTALVLSIVFIYLVLASLYESFVVPLTIMVVLPLAVCGAFYSLALTGKSLDINSMIGCILLIGIATKNSILLVDYANQKVREEGLSLSEAMIQAGRTRLRPILMTTVALIAGMLPIAIGLNEVSKQRTPMGVAIIGGLITSTLLSLLVVPAVYAYMERFRMWSSKVLGRIFLAD